MNKKTCKSIKYVIEQMHSYNPDEIKITIDNSQAQGSWFWKVKIVVSHRLKSYLVHFEKISIAIGHLYGEGLWTNLEKRTLKLS